MRKNLLMAIAFIAGGAFYASAQMQIPNSNFELWENLGDSDEEPNDWNGIKTGTGGSQGLAPQTLHRSTSVRPGSTGTYSARVHTVNVPVFNIKANGNLTTGRVNAGNSTPTNSANYNFSDVTNATYNATMTNYPDSLVAWVKYTNANNSDSARIRAVIHDNYNFRDPSDANALNHIVANATRNFAKTNGSWVRMSIPFTYTGPATTLTNILVTFTSNKTPGGGAANDEVLVDDMELIYNPVTTTASAISPLVYNVSATQSASISIPFTKTGIFHFGNIFTAQLSDASGSFASPVNIGTLTSTAAGMVTGTIPANTPSGMGYRVRVIASTPYQTANVNASDITINLVSNSIAPAAAQTISYGTNGNMLTVTEQVAATSREWKYATISGGPYTSFSPAQTGSTYTPNFINAGTYYVVCETTVGSLFTRSNEVTVNVVKNQITPAGSQSLLISTTGTTLTVNETPAGTFREWLYSTTSGGSYVAFSPTETGSTYQPLFNSAGTYYVVCKSVISGVNVTSNEVVISVGNLNITTGTITGSPFEFSASAPNASISVPYTVSGPFTTGNTFTAQLSDANGSFATATTIGTFNSITSGTINATIPSNTPDGNGYLIRVIGSNPSTLGSDNGTALIVDQFNNSITPASAQTFVYTSNGNTLTVNESQNATHAWGAAGVPGGPYSAILGENGPTFTPSSPVLGTFYVVCVSTNQYSDETLSNEVMITIENGNTLATSAVTGSPFYVSASAVNEVPVNFTSDVIFDNGNVFTAQLSNASGSFSGATNIGTLTSTTPGTIAATIPNVISDGSGYRIRVISLSPAIAGTDNGSDLQMVNFNISAAPADTQYISPGANCNAITLTSTHPNTDVEWKYRTAFIGDYFSFTPPVTGSSFVHAFPTANTYQIIAQGVNDWNDTLTTEKIIIKVSTSDINESENSGIKAYMNQHQFVVDLVNSQFQQPTIDIVNMAGQVVYTNQLQGKAIHTLPLSLASGIYTYRISENGKSITGKIPVL